MIKIKTALLTTAALAAAGLAYAAPRADMNKDGQVTQTEFMAAATTRFVNADTNADGVLTKDEMKAARQAKHDARAEKKFEGLDANSDGFVSKDEYDAKRAQHAEKRAERRDLNSDGVVDEADRALMKAKREARKAERQARRAEREVNGETRAKGEGRRGPRGGKKMRVPNPDANGDGVVTRAEYEASTLAMFERLDKNADGVLTKGEGLPCLIGPPRLIPMRISSLASRRGTRRLCLN